MAHDAPASSSGPALEPAALDALAEGVGTAHLAVIIDLVLESAPAAARALQDAAQAGDAKRVHHAAHQLRGDCSNMGATDLAGRLLRVEKDARASVLPACADIDEILASIPGFLAALRVERQARAAAPDHARKGVAA